MNMQNNANKESWFMMVKIKEKDEKEKIVKFDLNRDHMDPSYSKDPLNSSKDFSKYSFDNSCLCLDIKNTQIWVLRYTIFPLKNSFTAFSPRPSKDS